MTKNQIAERLRNGEVIELFTLNSGGKLQTWKASVNDSDGRGRIVQTYGLVDGKQQTMERFVLVGKNIGKSNETTPFEQAVLELASNVESKLKEGGVEDVTMVKPSTELAEVKQCMLANKLDAKMEQNSSKSLAKLKLIGKEIVVQPKLDGNRCITRIDARNIPYIPFSKEAKSYIDSLYDSKTGLFQYVESFTRKGERFKALPHIHRDLLTRVVMNESIERKEYWLDGELFTFKFGFNELNGMLKKDFAKRDDALTAKIENISYHLYDSMEDKIYKEREKTFSQFEYRSVTIVPSHYVTATNEIVEEYLLKFLEDGYEGAMVRNANTPYEYKRTWNLLKVKVFEDDEFLCVGMEESEKEPGLIKNFVCQLKTPIMVDGKLETTFNPGLKMSDEERKYALAHQSEYIGKWLTVTYFPYPMETEKPRFPKTNGIVRTDI